MASPLDPGDSWGFGQSEVSCQCQAEIKTLIGPTNMLWMFVLTTMAEMCERATGHLVAPAAGDAVGAGGGV